MRNRNLDGLRGIAALAVIAGHCELHYGGVPAFMLKLSDFPTQSLNQIFGRLWYSLFPGDAAVVVFFALSGYVLSQALERKGDAPHIAFIPYVVKRLFRLWPAGIVAGAVLALLVPMDLKTTIGSMLLFNSDHNGPVHSLQIEWFGFFLIFILWAANSAVFALVVMGLFFAYFKHPVAFFAPWGDYITLGPAFVLGYLIPRVSKTFWAIRPLPWIALSVLMLSDLYLGRVVSVRVFDCFAAFVLVGSMTARQSTFLESRPVQFVGKISYPMYLLGIPATTIAAWLVDSAFAGQILPRTDLFALAHTPQPYMAAKSAVLAAASIVLAIIMGWITHKIAEAPGIRIGSFVEKLIVRKEKETEEVRQTEVA